MLDPISVLLLYGGKSGEHEISLISAASVLAHLDAERYRIIPVGMDKQGRLYLNDYNELLQAKGALPVVTPHSRPLDSLLRNGRLAVDADVVFPVVHGPLYEDGCLQGIFDLADVAYVGCGVLSSALGMDKDMARRIVGINGILSARYRVLRWNHNPDELESFCQKTVAEFGWPLFVKPCSMGSSVGIQKVENVAALMAAIIDARRYDEEVLIEEFIKGREIELAVLESSSPHGLPEVSVPGEVRVNHADGFYSYTAKYLESEQTDLLIPAALDESLVARLQQLSSEIFRCLKCSGMARIDFFVDDETDNIYFNEINTIPGFTSISMYPRMWQASGLSYPILLDRLIRVAMLRSTRRAGLVRYYQ
jgi:D-alanine-D-alanine ligase